ncbi:hypothetical protein O3M35_002328 [Rhynocoris fuscipes]|uniref:Single domain-containing protein n=1 Tax=Rhynocoris fuscipes TaxID=488301 RepID=A0AAW1CP04_9HEMI
MFRLFLYILLFTNAFAQFSYEYQNQDVDGQIQCTDEEGAKRKLGEIWTEKKSCTQRRCLTNLGDKTIVQIQRCPKLEESNNCTIKQAAGTEFPDCCVKLICKN